MSDKLKRLMFINRQPSLWRHSCPAVEVEPCDDDSDVIKVSPLMIEPLNADFDGDTMALYEIHDVEALKEVEEKAYLLNNVFYDQDGKFLSTIRHEALYAAFILTKEEFDKEDIILSIKNLYELPETIELWNDYLYSAVDLNGEIYSYGVCLFNKWCEFDKIIINKSITKKNSNEVSAAIYNYFNQDKVKFYNVLTLLEKKLFIFITISKHCPSLDIVEMINIKDELSANLLKKLPKNNIMLGYHINEAITKRCILGMNKESTLYKLFKSGSRFSESQLARTCISIGYSADANNMIISEPISSSLLEGLSEREYFMCSPGTRKSIKDKAKFTPVSGYLERTLVMALSIVELDLEDCGTNTYLEIIISSSKQAQMLVGKYYRLNDNEEWKELDANVAEELVGTKVQIRSAMHCINPNFKICYKCFGTRKFPTKYVGITAGQNLTERITQLILRTFHESGRANLETNQTIRNFFIKNLIDIRNESNRTVLKFSTNEFPDILLYTGDDAPIRGLVDVRYETNELVFESDNRTIPNEDIISIMQEIRSVLKPVKIKNETPNMYYERLSSLLLSVGTVYSSFIEILFANMFLVEERKFWRYHQDETPIFKLGYKNLAAYINPVLGLLYQPNKKTISIVDLDSKILDSSNLSIYEKIWFNKL